jgi:predicted membrane metal-binding protein
MIGLAVALLAGELLSAWCTVGLGHAFAFGAVGLLARSLRAPVRTSAPAGWLAAAALGIALATGAAEPPRSGCFLPDADRATKLWVEARVDDAPTRGEDAIRVPVSVRTTDGNDALVCGSVLLTIASPAFAPHVGDRLRLHATLRRPRNFANPGAYDQAGRLARRRVWVTGYASGGDMARVGNDEPPWLPWERERIGALIDESLPPEDAGLLRALVVGDEGVGERGAMGSDRELRPGARALGVGYAHRGRLGIGVRDRSLAA